MMKRNHLLTASIALALIACSDDADKSSDAENESIDSKVVAIVDDQPITELDLTLHLQQRQQQGKITDLQEITEELINLKVVAMNAENAGYLDREDIKAELRRQHDFAFARVAQRV